MSGLRRVSAPLGGALLGWVGLVLAGPPAAAADGSSAPAADERIVSYDVTLGLRPDGTLAVTERIGYDFGAGQRHGISRDITTRQRYDPDHYRHYPVRDIRVTSPSGAPAGTSITDSGGAVHVRIGDPARTVTGRQVYQISYAVRAASTRLADRDELRWNAVGPGWTVPVQAATVRLTGPEPARTAGCYTGPVGSRTPCPLARITGRTVSYRGGPLAAGDALTVLAGLPPGSASPAAPLLVNHPTPGRFLIGAPWAATGSAGILVPAVLLVRYRHRRSRRARAANAAVPAVPEQRSAPDGIAPGLAGLLAADGVAGNPHVAATMADLVGRGYVRVTPTGDGDWQLSSFHPADDSLTRSERLLYEGLFRRWDEPRLTKLRPRLGPVFTAVKTALTQQAHRDGLIRSGWRFPWGWAGGLLLAAGIIATGWLGMIQRAGAVGIAGALAGILVIAAGSSRPPRLTAAGAAAKARVVAFRDWLSSLDQAKLSAAGADPGLQRLLPYAVAFNLSPELLRLLAPAQLAAGGRSTQPEYYEYTDYSYTSFHHGFAPPVATHSSSGGGHSGSSGDSSAARVRHRLRR